MLTKRILVISGTQGCCSWGSFYALLFSQTVRVHVCICVSVHECASLVQASALNIRVAHRPYHFLISTIGYARCSILIQDKSWSQKWSSQTLEELRRPLGTHPMSSLFPTRSWGRWYAAAHWVAFRKCTAHPSTLCSILHLGAVNQGPRCHSAHHYHKWRTGSRRGKARKALQDGRAAFRLTPMCWEVVLLLRTSTRNV